MTKILFQDSIVVDEIYNKFLESDTMQEVDVDDLYDFISDKVEELEKEVVEHFKNNK